MTPAAPFRARLDSTPWQRAADATSAAVTSIAGSTHAHEARQVYEGATGHVLREYLRHVHWPSRLTAQGCPVELSVAISDDSGAAVRSLLDLSDHRFDLEENWPVLVNEAERLTGLARPAAHDLFTFNLEGCDANSRTPVNHGTGYFADGRRRGSLYFFLGGSRARPVAERFPEDVQWINSTLPGTGASPRRIHSVSYDFDGTGRPTRRKFYAWIPANTPDDAQEVLRHDPTLSYARQFIEMFGSLGNIRLRDAAVLLQSSFRDGSRVCAHKIYVNLQGWSVDPREALLGSIAFAMAAGVDIRPLEMLLDAFQSHEVKLHPSWIAVGPGSAMTWYVVPSFGERDEWSVQGLRTARETAIRYLLSAMSADGTWSRSESQPADFRLTARATATLSAMRQLHDALAPAADWLSSRSEENPDLESSALSALALTRLGRTASARRPSRDDAPSTLLALQCRLAHARGADEEASDLIDRLIARQHASGAWNVGGDSIVATSDVVDVLAAALVETTPQIVDALSRASFVFSDHPASNDPVRAAMWLRGWIQSGLSDSAPSVQRALACLEDTQAPDGRWIAAPVRTGVSMLDGFDERSIASTCRVLEALDATCDRLANATPPR